MQGTASGPWAPPAGQWPASPGPMPMMQYPVAFRPPRNPIQSASTAAGVLMLIAGIFGLIFGTMTLTYDAFDEVRLEDDVFTTVLQPIPFLLAIVYLAGFVLSIIGCYGCFRLMRLEYAMLAPILLLIAYFMALLHEPYFLIFTLQIFILSLISLILLAYARSAFSAPMERTTRGLSGVPPT